MGEEEEGNVLHTDTEQAMDHLGALARETWEHEVSRHGARAEWLPKVLTYDDTGAVALVVPIGVSAEEPVKTSDIVIAALPDVVQSSTAWLAVTLDSYMSTDPALNMLAAVGSTTLHEQYARGNPAVLDTLFVHAVNRQGHQRWRHMPYRVKGNRVQWLEFPSGVIPPDAQMGGQLAEALVAAMTRHGN